MKSIERELRTLHISVAFNPTQIFQQYVNNNFNYLKKISNVSIIPQLQVVTPSHIHHHIHSDI